MSGAGTQLTRHAAKRQQQRNVHPLVVDLLYRYGREKQQSGSTVLYFDQRARDRARAALSETLDRFDKLSHAYLVEARDSGAIVTTGYRCERLRDV